MKKLISSLMLLFCLAMVSLPACLAQYTITINGPNTNTPPIGNSWYVTSSGAGAKNGTDQADAWAVNGINWFNVQGGDSVFICGLIRNTLNIAKSGAIGNNIIVRGDCPGNAGIIDGSNIINSSWTSVGSNVYTTPETTAVNGIVMENDYPLVQVAWTGNATTTIANMASFNQVPFFSSSSVTVATGSQTFTIPTGLTNVYATVPIKILYTANTSGEQMTGTVTSYNSTTGALVVNVTSKVGSATETYWKFELPGGLFSYDTSGQVLYVETYGLDTPANYTMEASYGPHYSQLLTKLGYSYVTLENLTVKDAGDYNVAFENGTGDIVTGNTFYNSTNWGVFALNEIGMNTYNNTLYRVCWQGALPQALGIGEGIRYHTSTGGNIYNNNISNVPAIGIVLYHSTGGINVYNNIIHDNNFSTGQYSNGIYSDGSSNNFIFGNFIYDFQCGIQLDGEATNFHTSNTYVYNNLIYNYALNGLTLGFSTLWYGSENNFIFNNTVVTGPINSGSSYSFNVTASYQDTVQNNLFYGNINFITSGAHLNTVFVPNNFDYNTYYPANTLKLNDGATTDTLAEWQTFTSGETHSTSGGAITLSSLFVSSLSLNFNLLSGSHAVNGGTNLNSIFSPLALDYSSNSRPAAGTGSYDTGALNTPGI